MGSASWAGVVRVDEGGNPTCTAHGRYRERVIEVAVGEDDGHGPEAMFAQDLLEGVLHADARVDARRTPHRQRAPRRSSSSRRPGRGIPRRAQGASFLGRRPHRTAWRRGYRRGRHPRALGPGDEQFSSRPTLAAVATGRRRTEPTRGSAWQGRSVSARSSGRGTSASRRAAPSAARRPSAASGSSPRSSWRWSFVAGFAYLASVARVGRRHDSQPRLVPRSQRLPRGDRLRRARTARSRRPRSTRNPLRSPSSRRRRTP